MTEDRPKLRLLDVVPVQTQGGQQFLLRDPQRLSPQELVVPPDIAFLLSQFDGSHTIREAQVSYVQRFGSLITTDQIKDWLRQLEDALLLDTERFREFGRRLQAEFRSRPTRAAAHAGQSYEEGAAAFISTWQPRLDAAAPPDAFALDEERPALIAPHYDMTAAAESYAAAYALLAQGPQADAAVVLGIEHTGGSAPFTLTRKPFETPFGALETDAEIIDQLAEAAEFDVFADEFLHRDEHSVEFQAVLLHFLYCEREEQPKIVPILCGGYQRQDGELADPGSIGPVSEFLEALRAIIAEDSRRVAVIASADLSHIGARFGQPPPLTQTHLDLARRHDMALLEQVKRGDPEGLYQVFAQDENRYNVCGVPAIYALLRALPIREGRLLSYKQATEPQTQSCVSFGSVGVR